MPRLEDEIVREATSAESGHSTQGSGGGIDLRVGWRQLPAGEAFTLAGAGRITESAPTRLVMLVGDRRVGKTTLVAEIHHAFLAGAVGEYVFSGSATLPAFEERAFRSRMKSRRRRPETARTSLASGVRLFHLAVRQESLVEPPMDLLIADISGEAFRAMRMRREDVEALAPLLRRADNVVVMVDGGLIAAPKFAQKARADVRTLLRTMLEGGALSRRSVVNLVITKWDKVVLAGDEAAAAAVGLLEQLQSQFAEQLGSLSCHQIAARSTPNASLAPYHGLSDLFSTFCNARVDRRQGHDFAVPGDSRSFLRYGRSNDVGRGLPE